MKRVSSFSEAIRAGRLGRLLQCDCYVKWYRPPGVLCPDRQGDVEERGRWGAHQSRNSPGRSAAVVRWSGSGNIWSVATGALHRIEAEDVVSAVVSYASGATGVIQASTAIWPGYPERIDLHGTKGSAVITGDHLTSWDVMEDSGPPPPLGPVIQSGASDPMAISLQPFERQFLDFAAAIKNRHEPSVSGEEGYLDPRDCGRRLSFLPYAATCSACQFMKCLTCGAPTVYAYRDARLSLAHSVEGSAAGDLA